VTFVNFPTTEFLQPASLDFVSFNVYLHEPRPLCELPSTVTEYRGRQTACCWPELHRTPCGKAKESKAQILGGHIEIAFRAGLAVYFFLRSPTTGIPAAIRSRIGFSG